MQFQSAYTSSVFYLALLLHQFNQQNHHSLLNIIDTVHHINVIAERHSRETCKVTRKCHILVLARPQQTQQEWIRSLTKVSDHHLHYERQWLAAITPHWLYHLKIFKKKRTLRATKWHIIQNIHYTTFQYQNLHDRVVYYQPDECWDCHSSWTHRLESVNTTHFL
jgi:NAD-dependent dihydropyrimidine dehydrogenase PreA subunit